MLTCSSGQDDDVRRSEVRAPSVVAPLEVGDLVAYGSGLERELALTGAAVVALRRARDPNERAVLAAGADPVRIGLEGARAAGLTADRYRRLVGEVDSILLGLAGADPARAVGRLLSARAKSRFATIAPRLDSLRVALVVLRARVAAEAARSCTERRRLVPESVC